MVDGLDEEGKLATLYSYGARGVALRALPSFEPVWDSGLELERAIAQFWPSVFNSNPNNDDLTPEEAFDRRSDDRVGLVYLMCIL